MHKKNLPNILVMTQNKIQPFTGGGVVLSNLFTHFPTENLFFLHRDKDYGLPEKYTEYYMHGGMLKVNMGLACKLLWQLLKKNQYLRLEGGLPGLIKLLIQSSCFRLPSRLDKKIKSFKPDVIYAWAGDALWARSIKIFAERYHIPYVIHFMDNQIGIEPDTVLEQVLYPEFKRCLGQSVERADMILTISDSMGKAYSELWQKNYRVFRGMIDITEWPLPKHKNSNKEFTLAFTGSIESGQLKGLRDVAEAVDYLSDHDISIRLVLYLTAEYEKLVREHFHDFRSIEYKPHPKFSELQAVLAEADLLVLAYGFDQATINYYRHSFATKIVPYMLSGTSILVYGPACIEPIDYVQRGGWASIVNDHGVDHLVSAILALQGDIDKRRQLAKRAYQAACEEHDLLTNASEFSELMTHIVQKSKHTSLNYSPRKNEI
ncbi:hypothetical protein AB835_08600 [Candidatus Endobugula sertula]|uniref:Glycosyltransferase subfamily 4-like N-terminal domain-containing protein n=1 Tax=Candidatus Endobugula sertula TaxID=62101 RepID=A0A1D2QPN5_9GAMM|nr:hypothetical protein AB835_08600 [Candidatus Endobugula sertula]